jgi:hypothetical protein
MLNPGSQLTIPANGVAVPRSNDGQERRLAERKVTQSGSVSCDDAEPMTGIEPAYSAWESYFQIRTVMPYRPARDPIG